MILNSHSNNRMSARLPLAAFAAVSIGIHISVLLINFKRPVIDLGLDSKNEISVYLNQSANQRSHKKAARQIESSTLSPTTELGHKVPATELVHNENQQQRIDTASIRQKKIIGQLQQELARFFYYPPQAERRGIQGQVIIGFKLNQQGRINSVSVSKSSGHTVLDNAALDAFNQASRIFSTTTSSVTEYLTIPVKYQLSGG